MTTPTHGHLLGQLLALIEEAGAGDPRLYERANTQPAQLIPALGRATGAAAPGLLNAIQAVVIQLPDNDPFPDALPVAEQAAFAKGYYAARREARPSRWWYAIVYAYGRDADNRRGLKADQIHRFATQAERDAFLAGFEGSETDADALASADRRVRKAIRVAEHAGLDWPIGI